jgi:hypothetical protein
MRTTQEPRSISKRSLFEKSSAKTFLLPGDVQTTRVKVLEVFCGAFFQKSDLFLSREKENLAYYFLPFSRPWSMFGAT